MLAIGYSAGRSGGPRVLLRILEELADQGWQISAALLSGGPVLDEYRERDPGVKVLHLARKKRWFGLALLLRAAGQSSAADKIDSWRLRLIQTEPGDVDVVLVNSAPSLEALAPRGKLGPPVVALIHELDYAWQQLLSGSLQRRLLSEPSAFITSSQAVSDYLVGRGVDPDKIHMVRLPFAVPSSTATTVLERGRPGRVLAMATLEWRKGADLFLQAALQCERLHPGEVEWVWVGDGLSAADVDHFRRDIRLAGLQDVVRHERTANDATPFYDSADVFALTSREDPYPLVVLEAASRGRPVVCFAGAGGAPEFVGRGAGAVVAPLDVVAFAEAVWLRTVDRVLAQAEGSRGSTMASEEHGAHQAGRAINHILERVL